ncbi:MAG: CAD protein-like [Candidatus Peregrinibacteria bacterium Greene0416_19]|nr:MAG: CAD protein-like [Candidatus Peregrinibacteria bacterium Greene0416_19]
MTQLILADGTAFEGTSFGAPVDADGPSTPACRTGREFGTGEVVFNTGMAGYPESMTDPSYHGQILVFTYPLIGNYGVPSEELNEHGFSKYLESENIHVRAIVCAQVSETYSHHAAVQSLQEWMTKHGIPGLTGVDTRMLTKKLREHGVMLGALVQDSGIRTEEIGKEKTRVPSPESRVPDIEDPNTRNLVAEVSCKDVIIYDAPPAPDQLTVIAYDCGMKRNILRSFLKRGVRVVRVPWDFDLDAYDGHYDGVFISNGPGDPKTCVPTIKAVACAIENNVPTFGICLGNQLMALAVGGDTYKLKYGHRGCNQPCVECAPHTSKRGERCIITSQNHGFAVDETLPKGWSVWFRNANDGTVEGIRHESGRFFSVQFHPEATPGPEDANGLFDAFLGIMRHKN